MGKVVGMSRFIEALNRISVKSHNARGFSDYIVQRRYVNRWGKRLSLKFPFSKASRMGMEPREIPR
jgi:hypothetical protein